MRDGHVSASETKSAFLYEHRSMQGALTHDMLLQRVRGTGEDRKAWQVRDVAIWSGPSSWSGSVAP